MGIMSKRRRMNNFGSNDFNNNMNQGDGQNQGISPQMPMFVQKDIVGQQADGQFNQ